MAIPKLIDVEISSDRKSITLAWNNNESARFHAIWLRDNCLDANTRDPQSHQRLLTIQDIPENISMAQAGICESRNSLEFTFTPNDYSSEFPSSWLYQYRYSANKLPENGFVAAGIELWNEDLANNLPRASWKALLDDDNALAQWLRNVRRYGFALIYDLPVTDNTVSRVVERFGFVRTTNYGRYFDVRAEVNASNLAYTSLGLQVHTDNPYRDPVPGLQLLHCLQSDADGGESTLVDGFKAALVLREENRVAFDLLSSHSVRFEFCDEGKANLSAKAPLITLSPEGEILEVRFNNRSTAPFNLPFDVMEDYYAAYRAFAEILERPEMEVSFHMKAGELFIVDNRRVMHGRKGYSGAGSRHLQGCYADRDGLYSKLAVLSQNNLT